MSVQIDTALVQNLINQKYGTVPKLVEEWDMRVAEKIQSVGKSRDISNVRRWLRDKFPKQEDAVFGFAAVLDIDPLALVDLNVELVGKQLNLTRRLFQDGFYDGVTLPPFWALYKAIDGWPNNNFANSYYNRSWSTVEFTHNPPANVGTYAAALLQPTTKKLMPTVFHFAFRRLNVPDKRWRPYGAVVAYENCIKLVSGSGDLQVRDRRNHLVPVETQFGAGHAEFRIASIHKFDFELEIPSKQIEPVRFEA